MSVYFHFKTATFSSNLTLIVQMAIILLSCAISKPSQQVFLSVCLSLLSPLLLTWAKKITSKNEAPEKLGAIEYQAMQLSDNQKYKIQLVKSCVYLLSYAHDMKLHAYQQKQQTTNSTSNASKNKAE